MSGEVFFPTGSKPGLAPGCSANSFSPLSDPPPPLPPQPPGCQSAWLLWAKQVPAIGPKGHCNCCQLGQHFTAEHHSPNKQCNGTQATGNMEPVITSRAWLVHSPKPKPGQGLECVLHFHLHLHYNFSARVCHKRIPFQNYARSSEYQGVFTFSPYISSLSVNIISNWKKQFKEINDKMKMFTYECKTVESRTVSWD